MEEEHCRGWGVKDCVGRVLLSGLGACFVPVCLPFVARRRGCLAQWRPGICYSLILINPICVCDTTLLSRQVFRAGAGMIITPEGLQ